MDREKKELIETIDELIKLLLNLKKLQLKSNVSKADLKMQLATISVQELRLVK